MSLLGSFARPHRSTTSGLSLASGRLSRFRNASQLFPKTLDVWDSDEEFCAFDYTPDEYDAFEMIQMQSIDGEASPQANDVSGNRGFEDEDESDTAVVSPGKKLLSETLPTIATGKALGAMSGTSDMVEIPKQEEEAATPVPETERTTDEIPAPSSRRRQSAKKVATTTELDRFEQQLQTIRQLICQQTGIPKFNPNSPRQVSEALFGDPGESTNKVVLEALAARGNQLADQMLKFRQLAREVNKRKKKQEHKEQGTLVKSVYTVKRSTPEELRPQQQPPKEQSQEPPLPNTTVKKEPELSADIQRNDPLLLVDASAYIFRAYYAFPPLHRSDGMPVGAVLGFCNMLNRLVLTIMMEGKQPRIVLVFDAPGKTFRHELYDLYKANRPPAPVDLAPQFALVRQAAKAYGIVQIEAPTYEADDVIATLATMAQKEGIDCNILSGDKDLMQLVTPSDITPSVQMIDPMSMSRVSYEDVVEKWGVGPDKLGDVLALAGDTSDNVPGVPGIGPKIASVLIDSFGSLEGLLENVESVKQKGRREKLQANIEQARLSRVLVELERNVPMDLMTFPEGIDQVSELRMAPMDADCTMHFFDEMGLKDLKRRFQNRLEIQQGFTPKLKETEGINASKRKVIASRWAPRPKATIPKPEDFADVPF